MDVVKVGFRFLYATRREWSMCRSQVACLDIEQRETRLFCKIPRVSEPKLSFGAG